MLQKSLDKSEQHIFWRLTMAPPRQPTRRKDDKTDITGLPRPPSLLDNSYSSISPPPDLPPVPIKSQDILSRPPFPETPRQPSIKEEDILNIQDDVTTDILKELRHSDFGSFLEHIPEEKQPRITADEIESARFLADKDSYLEAGKKHLELNFVENASMNFSCAILCLFLGEDVFAAAHLIAKIASTLPPSIVNSYFFQGVKLLLKANLLKNASYLDQAEKWLLKDTDHLYKEDTEIIRRALRQSELNLEIH